MFHIGSINVKFLYILSKDIESQLMYFQYNNVFITNPAGRQQFDTPRLQSFGTL